MLSRHAARMAVALIAVSPLFFLTASFPAQDQGQGQGQGHATVVGAGRISGRITSQDGKTSVVGATVRAYHLDAERIYTSGRSNSKGKYQITGVPHGYVDLAVETSEGIFVANQAVNVPPAGDINISFTLSPFRGRPQTWWDGREPPKIPGTDETPAGIAEVQEKSGRGGFWKSPAGIAVIAGGSGLSILAIAGGGSDAQASPSSP